jgi:3-oxoacyl-[acyl-carrier-protein] synthase-3
MSTRADSTVRNISSSDVSHSPIGIKAVGVHVPEHFIANSDRAEQFGVDEDFIRSKLGVEVVSRMAPGQDTADMALLACRDLGGSLVPESIDCLVVCTQNPHGHGIPHTSAVLHGMLGLDDRCACFDISLGCSGYVYGLSVVTAFMQANALHNALLVTADPYSKIVDPDDRTTAMLFGDAATATLLGTRPILVPHGFQFGTRGADGAALHNNEGTLSMNGRAVFGFSSSSVPAQVKAVLDMAGISAEEVDLYLFHQGSRFIVEKIAQKLGLPAARVPIELAAQGNTLSSSIPMMLKNYLHDQTRQTLLLSGFGVGLSWASCLATRNPETGT